MVVFEKEEQPLELSVLKRRTEYRYRNAGEMGYTQRCRKLSRT